MGIQEVIKMKLGALLLLVAFTTSIKAQSFDYEIKVKAQESAVNEFDTSYLHKLNIHVLDTANITAILIRGGSSSGQNNLINDTIVFDQTTFLPVGRTYYRRKNEVHIGLGKFDTQHVYYNLSIQDTLGNISAPLLKNTINP